MKKDLFTAVVVGITGVVIAFFVCNLFLSPIESVTYKTLEKNVSTDIVMPNPEVFNYRALNPTVEVYVGECEVYNEVGECLDDSYTSGSSTESGEER